MTAARSHRSLDVRDRGLCELPRSAVGRMPVALVADVGGKETAIIVSAMVRAKRDSRVKGLTVKGSTRITAEALAHFCEDILPHVHRLVSALGVSTAGLELCVTAPEAAHAHGLAVEIAGSSLDASFELLALSSLIWLPLRQDSLATGALSPAADRVHQVRGLKQKLHAALAAPSLRRFVCPPVDADDSVKTLSPALHREISEELEHASGRIEIITAATPADLLRACVTEDALLEAAFRSGYFQLDCHDPGFASGDACLEVLTGGLDSLFRQVVREHLHNGRIPEARSLLEMRLRYHLRQRSYPQGLGQILLNLVRGVPPVVRSRWNMFSLIPLKLCFQVGQLADGSAEADAISLIAAATCRLNQALPAPRARRPRVSPGDRIEEHVQAFISAVSADTLAIEIESPIDEVRCGYPLVDLDAADPDVFQDAITAFYVAMAGRLDKAPAATLQADEAVELLSQAFARDGGVSGARAEARYRRGGLYTVLGRMAEAYKHRLKVERVNRVMEQYFKQLDWDDRCALMKALLARLGDFLSPDLRSLNPAQLVGNPEPIALAYVQGLDRMSAVLRRY